MAFAIELIQVLRRHFASALFFDITNTCTSCLPVGDKHWSAPNLGLLRAERNPPFFLSRTIFTGIPTIMHQTQRCLDNRLLFCPYASSALNSPADPENNPRPQQPNKDDSDAETNVTKGRITGPGTFDNPWPSVAKAKKQMQERQKNNGIYSYMIPQNPTSTSSPPSPHVSFRLSPRQPDDSYRSTSLSPFFVRLHCPTWSSTNPGNPNQANQPVDMKYTSRTPRP